MRFRQAIADKGQVVSLSQWKYRMLGRTPMCPGVSTMVANIVESHTRWVPEGFPISHWFECVRRAHSVVPVYVCGPNTRVCGREYAHGLAHEVYPIVLTRAFKGLTFAEAVRRIFQQFSVVLLGVVQDGQVALNPQGSVLEEGMVSFVLAHSARLAHLISTGFSPDDLVTLSSDVRGAAVFANNGARAGGEGGACCTWLARHTACLTPPRITLCVRRRVLCLAPQSGADAQGERDRPRHHPVHPPGGGGGGR